MKIVPKSNTQDDKMWSISGPKYEINLTLAIFCVLVIKS